MGLHYAAMAKGDESLDALRDAIRRRGQADTASEEQRFRSLAREYEAAVVQLVAHIHAVFA